jgi:ribose transport system substrate-binding protein
VISSLDASTIKPYLKKIGEEGIKVVTYHSSAAPGKIKGVPEVFWNLSTDPYKLANLAGKYAVVHSNGTAKAVIQTDPQYAIVVTKTNGAKDGIEACATCSVLSVENMPYGELSQRTPSLVSALLQRYGKKLGYIIAVNDLYFDFTVPTWRSAGIEPGSPPFLISSGDGSPASYERVRKGQYQIATVPEPLNMMGWQAVDELNRAFQGEEPSGYVTKVHLVVKENVDADGGVNNRFDPGNGYRDEYKKIWGIN